MKKILISTLFLVILSTISCSNDDDTSDTNLPAGEAVFQATINGDSYSNYSFTLGIYEVVKGTNGNTLSINVGDTNGDMVNLFLNGTNGFGNGTVKEMGNIDSNNFTTFASIRQANTQITYFSLDGSLTITSNREHPSKSGHRLLSGNFNVTASTANGSNTTTMSGSFTELDFVE